MRKRLACVALSAVLSGCVFGYGRCLFLQPFKVSLAGKIHFRDYPAGGGVDHVAVLALDRTEYVYAPAHAFSCLPVNDLQLEGWSEFPPDVVENSAIVVDGSLFATAAQGLHTPFGMRIRTIVPSMRKMRLE